jgi:hypothetical protein
MIMRRHDLGQLRSDPPVWAIRGHLGSRQVGSGGQRLGKGVSDALHDEPCKRRSRAAGECRATGPGGGRDAGGQARRWRIAKSCLWTTAWIEADAHPPFPRV